MVLLKFNRPSHLVDPDLTETLKAELAGIFLWALDGLARLQARGHFEIPEACLAEIAEIKEQISPIYGFLTACGNLEPGAVVDCEEAFDAYVEWCRRNKYSCMAFARFGADLKAFRVERRRCSTRHRTAPVLRPPAERGRSGLRPGDAAGGPAPHRSRPDA